MRKKTHKISFYTEEGEKVSFEKNDSEWKCLEDEKIPLVQDKISALFDDMETISAERTIEDVKNLADYGLDDPVNVVEIETTEGMVESVAIGAKNASTGHTYIYLNGNTDVVYTVSEDLGSIFSVKFLDFAESENFPSLLSCVIEKIEVIKKEDSFSLLKDASSSSGWFVEDEEYGRKTADDYAGDNLESMMQVLSYAAYYDYDCKDLSIYGLDVPLMEIRVTYREEIADVGEEDYEEEHDEGTEEVQTEAVIRNMVLYVGNLDEDGYYYVRLDDSTAVYGIEQTHIDKLLGETAVDYWNLNLKEIAISDLDYLEVEYEDNVYVLKRVITEQKVEKTDDESGEEAAETEFVTAYYVNDAEVDGDAFMKFYRNALAIECQERLISCEPEEEAELVLRYYGINGEKVIISYFPWDGSFYAVADDAENYGLVNKMNVKNLMELFRTVIE